MAYDKSIDECRKTASRSLWLCRIKYLQVHVYMHHMDLLVLVTVLYMYEKQKAYLDVIEVQV